MSIVKKVKRLVFPDRKIPRKELEALRGLPSDTALDHLGRILHKMCIDHAADFVCSEKGGGDSPFHGVHKQHLFHEMLLVNLWIVDHVFSGKKQHISAEVRKRHADYVAIMNNEKGHKALQEMPEKHRKFKFHWDEYTGHQDEFGQYVTENIFGKDSIHLSAQTSFWIITYTDETIKRFSEVKAMLRELKIETPANHPSQPAR